MNLRIYNQIKLILFLFLLMISSLGIQAQNTHSAKISDKGIGSAPAVNSAILELESTTKGFLLPRMTTLQRDAISITDVVRGNGLSIFNIDTNCINYYSRKTSEWLSLCGKMNPAQLELGDCAKIALSASGTTKLKQGKYLSNTDILYLEINIIKAGTVDITVASTNGYFFSGHGEYTVPGIYMIALEGMGTPVNGSLTPGDKMKITLNGVDNTTCDFYIQVDPSGVSYIITQNPAANAQGNAYIGVPLVPQTNIVEVDVDVLSIGYWKIESVASQRGVSVSGSGNFTQTGQQKVTLIVQGTPTQSGDILFEVLTNSITNPPAIGYKVVKVTVLPVNFTTLCNDLNYPIKFVGSYTEDSNIGDSNYIQMPIKVSGTGRVTVTLKAEALNASGTKLQDLDFKAENVNLVMGQNVDNVQFIYLKAPNVKLQKGVARIEFTSITSSPATTASLQMCADLVPITVKEQPINYTLACSSAKVNGAYFVDKDLISSTHYIELDVNANYVSPYVITTNEVNGVKFEARGTFTGLGVQKVKLLPIGKYTVGGAMQYTISTDSDVAATTCSITVNVTYRDVNILLLGGVNYGPSINNTYSPGKIINDKALFGPNGKVRIHKIVMHNNYRQGTDLQNFINNNNIDIVFISVGYGMSNSTVSVLTDFVRNKKGFLIYSDENNMHNANTGKALMDNMNEVAVTTHFNQHPNYAHAFDLSSTNQNVMQLLQGSFGTIQSDQFFGLDVMNGYNVTLPANSKLHAVALYPGTNTASFGVHESLGFVFVGDGGWVIGDTTNTSWDLFPAKVDGSNNPIPKSGYGPSRDKKVVNSILYANLMEYAIKYVTKNKN